MTPSLPGWVTEQTDSSRLGYFEGFLPFFFFLRNMVVRIVRMKQVEDSHRSPRRNETFERGNVSGTKCYRKRDWPVSFGFVHRNCVSDANDRIDCRGR